MQSDMIFHFESLKDKVNAIGQDAVLSVLEGQTYLHSQVNEWIQNMTTSCIEDLHKLTQNFKFFVSCHIQEKKGAALNTYSTAFWDEKSDGSCIISWENTSLTAIIHVFGCAI